MQSDILNSKLFSKLNISLSRHIALANLGGAGGAPPKQTQFLYGFAENYKQYCLIWYWHEMKVHFQGKYCLNRNCFIACLELKKTNGIPGILLMSRDFKVFVNKK